MKDSFIIYTKYGEQISLLSDVQAGVLFRALIAYQSGEELPKMDGMTSIVFSVIRQQMDYDNDKYQEVCEVNKANGQRGGRPAKSLKNKGEKPKKPSGFKNEENKPNGFSENRTKPKKPESDNDYESDITPLFIPPQSGEKKTEADLFFEKYPRYAKDRAKMRVDADYKRLMEEFERSAYLRSLYTVKQINDLYPLIIVGDYRDKEAKKDPATEAADVKADRDSWYAVRRQKAMNGAEKFYKCFMQDEEFAKIEKRLRVIEIEQAKAELKADKQALAKLEIEQARLKLQRRGIIERNGMTEEDLLPKWHCKRCQDTGFLDGKPCDCYEKEKRR